MHTGHPKQQISIFPILCPHCRKYTEPPPESLLNLMVAMPPGKGKYRDGARYYTAARLVQETGLTRQRIDQVLHQAFPAGLVDTPFGRVGVYCKSRRGHVFLSNWKRYGWTPDPKRRWATQHSLR